jgi:hypothetical protein
MATFELIVRPVAHAKIEIPKDNEAMTHAPVPCQPAKNRVTLSIRRQRLNLLLFGLWVTIAGLLAGGVLGPARSNA